MLMLMFFRLAGFSSASGNLLTSDKVRVGSPAGIENGIGLVENRRKLVGGLDGSERDVGEARASYAGLASQYTWWKSGQLKQVRDKLDSTTTPRVTSYFWKIDGRLEKVVRPNGSIREISYDPTGRPDVIQEYGPSKKLIFVHKHGYHPSDELAWCYQQPAKRTSGIDPPASAAMTYNADNQLETWDGQTITHDADGNMTTGPPPTGNALVNYTFDARNRLTAALGSSFTYDSENQRIGLTDTSGTTTYTVDSSSALSKVLVRVKNGVSTRYIWGLGLLYEVNGSGATAKTVTYHSDIHGSTLALTDDTAKVTERIGYTPWGQINHRVNLSGVFHDTPFLFGGFFGNQTDSNGLIHMRARYYHPRIARFLNADPARDGMNWYQYAGGNPIGFVDPMGLGIDSTLNSVQNTLSFLGMTPVFGAVPDIVNTAISIGRGNYVDAGINFVSSIPGLGDAVGGAKLVAGTYHAGSTALGLVAGSAILGRTTATTQIHHLIPQAVFRDTQHLLPSSYKLQHSQNLMVLATPLHGNHPSYNNFVQAQILEMASTGPISMPQLVNLQSELRASLNLLEQPGGYTRMNDYFKYNGY
jgi:RHS repeat-associated protein